MNTWQGILGSAVLGLVLSGDVLAQQTGDDVYIEEIVVTAQKREQPLQEVPISVTAFSEQAIERAGITEFIDYASKTPNMGFSTQGNRSSTRIAIRGVTNIGGKANSVGVYVDEFNIAPNILVTGQSRTADTGLYDVERIEVLRGPQGTYFGRNTMGGAISITTRKPDTEAADGALKLEADDWGGYLGRLTWNQPLSETAALLATGYYREVGGFLDNAGPSGAENEGDEQGIRLALRVAPGDRLTLDISAEHTEYAQDMQSLVPTGELGSIPSQLVDVVNFFPFLFAPLPAAAIDTSQFPEWPLPVTDVPFWPGNHEDIATDRPFESESDTDMVVMNIGYDITDNVSLASVTGWIENDFDLFGDGDLSVHPAFTVGRDSTTTAWSQELRLSSYGNERFDWMLGLIYSEDEIEETDISTHLASDPYLEAWGALLFALGAQQGQVDLTDPQIQGALQAGLIPSIFAPLTVGNFEDVDRANSTDSLALFGEAVWHVTDDLDISLGLRWTDDELTFTEVTRPTVTLPVGDDRQEVSFDDISPRLTVNWFPREGTMLYGTVSKGYKVGGVNSDVTASLEGVEKFFDEETGWNYEAGVKSTLLGGRLQLNAAIFYFDWQDLQVRGQDVLSQRQFVQNAADAESQGLELEATAALGENTTLRFGYGLLDSEFGDFPNAVDFVGDVFDASGNAIPFAPENTFTASLDMDIPLDAAFDGYLRLDYSYIDDQFADAENSESRRIPSYDVVNLRGGIRTERYDLALWLKNALDEEYVLGHTLLETYYTGLQRAVGAPRQIGVTLNWYFR